MNALQRFFGREAYDEMSDSDVLDAYPDLCVERPRGFMGGGDHPTGAWLMDVVGIDNHCWLSATDRASHIFFSTAELADQFRHYLNRAPA